MEAEYNGDGKGEVFGHDIGKEIDGWVGMHAEIGCMRNGTI